MLPIKIAGLGSYLPERVVSSTELERELGLQPGDVHLNLSSPGWAKHAWSSFFAPWLAEATVLAGVISRQHSARDARLVRGGAARDFAAG